MQSNDTKQRKIALLQDFKTKVKRWFDGQYEPGGKDALRAEINKFTAPARTLVAKAGFLKLMTVGAPPIVGGMVAQNIDPFSHIFTSFWGTSLIPNVIDMVDSAIGALEDPYGLDHQDEPETTEMERLSPLPVIVSVLFEKTSDEVIEIVSLCGLEVDWTVTKEQEYSNSTRKRAYRPRVDSELGKLSKEGRLRAAWIIASELIKRDESVRKQLDERLVPVGWTVDHAGLSPSHSEVSELFFPKGSEHDAYVGIRSFITTACKSIKIADGYMDETIFALLSRLDDKKVKVCLLTSKVSSDFKDELRKFAAQYQSMVIEVQVSRDFHDRFAIIDDAACYHLGASIKDAGKRSFMMSKVESPDIIKCIQDHFEDAWVRAQQEGTA